MVTIAARTDAQLMNSNSYVSSSTRSARKRPRTISFSHLHVLATYGGDTCKQFRTSSSAWSSSDTGICRERRSASKASLRAAVSILWQGSGAAADGATSALSDGNKEASCGETWTPFWQMEPMAWPNITRGAALSACHVGARQGEQRGVCVSKRPRRRAQDSYRWPQ
jgi:hypothetical protein